MPPQDQPVSPERPESSSQEKPQPKLEAAPKPSAVAPDSSQPTASPPQPPANPTPPQPTASTPPAIPTPAVASDVDVIEKEWVDAAESAVKTHTGDPHAEEEAFEDLQVDYLKKRYGKDIKKPEE